VIWKKKRFAVDFAWFGVRQIFFYKSTNPFTTYFHE